MWLAFPASDYYGHSVTLGLSSRRPSRSSMMQHYSVREAVHSCLPRPHWAVLDPQRSHRPSACLCDESTWLLDAVARGPPLTDGHWTSGSVAFAMSRGSRRATVLASSLCSRLYRQALVPSPFRVQVSR